MSHGINLLHNKPKSVFLMIINPPIGIGKGTVLGFIASGVKKISITDIDQKALDGLAIELNGQYDDVDVLAIHMDVASESSVNSAVEETVKRFGRIDIAINNAGVSGPRGSTFETSFEEWQSTININLHGVWLCQRAEIKQMSQQEYYPPASNNFLSSLRLLMCELRSKGPRHGRGVIINVSSMYGVVGISSEAPATAYAASKHAVVGLTRTV